MYYVICIIYLEYNLSIKFMIAYYPHHLRGGGGGGGGVVDFCLG